MTPAERLLAAADLLDKRAGEATEGPWHAAPEIDGVYADRMTVVRPAHGKRIVAVGQVRPHSAAGEQNVAYIATMHPEVGKALAAWLRAVAHRSNAVADTVGRGWASATVETIVAGNVTAWTEALDLADLILASAA